MGCREGELFDNNSGKCMNQQFINNKCVHATEILEQHESKGDQNDILQQNSSFEAEVEQKVDVSVETFAANYLPDLCPLGFVGVRSLAGDCEHYFDCNNGLLESSYVCGVGFKFDNGQSSCVSERLVGSKCTASTQETSSNQHQATDSSEEDKKIAQSASSPESEAAQHQMVGPWGDSNDNLPSESFEEAQQILASSNSREEQHQEPNISGNQNVMSTKPPVSPSPTSVAIPMASFNHQDGTSKGKSTFIKSSTSTPTSPKIDSDRPEFYWVKKDFINGLAKNGERAQAQICCYRWMLSMPSIILVMQLL